MKPLTMMKRRGALCIDGWFRANIHSFERANNGEATETYDL
ncbi:hypothetical protein [Spartinivicinus marinus]|nr:hypothetical protein [Spartinivicinus marinus]MCX4029399.1 hypothetical protein [Spartinivicinus marinus]